MLRRAALSLAFDEQSKVAAFIPGTLVYSGLLPTAAR
jgi:hypothetical protein